MDNARATELIAAERARVTDELSRLEAEFRPDASDTAAEENTAGDGAVDITERTRDLERIDALRLELAAVERAEARLAEGTYGISIESGQPISDARLERIPTAERTADEQREFERLGG